ncbi:MAG: ABC transporter ATP-binding protein [Candidatus Thioglobus sp.]|nr:MAG: ABC transporter ATP-binding protein [Candidatus Thioglobus sp.]RUM79467.1 MAG: ABC transporter ATP-binding protein [Candidatus Thioglobus sp.]RUM81196.1 MAG: ABC transporter ATP-binding protein [Candidatus Thioglobus sp.]RUM83578.1 MAG: ABC transporter ATP-binding protein [Candidatus Thioglobus sp.]
MPKPLLSVEDLSIFTKSQKIVKNISFSINQGEIFALVGESGSGKSLTALSIVDLLTKNLKKSGKITYEDTDLSHAQNIQNFRGSEIAFIFQDPSNSLNPIMTIGEQVDEVLALHTNLSKKQRKSSVLDLFEQVDLDTSAQMYARYPHQVSGGQKQRVMIACALAGGAKLLIADEPTTALDVTTQKQVLELLLELRRNRKLSILLITHDLSVVKLMADRVAVMHQGSIIENRDKTEFFQNPIEAYSKNLLVSLPKGNRDQAFGDVLIKGDKVKVYFPIKTGLFRRTTDYVRAVDDISFSLKQGQNLAIVGESGSGKTTLAKAIMRQLDLYDGCVSMGNKAINHYDRKSYASKVQIVFQNVTSSFNPRMRILQTLLEGLETLNPNKANLSYLAELLQEVELDPELMHRYPHELSGGQLQRLSIARAISVNPEVIICDEPTSALDATVKVQILNLLLRLQREKGVSYIIITHDISIVDYFADHMIVMKQGKALESGSTQEILNNPQNDYTQALLSSVLS